MLVLHAVYSQHDIVVVASQDTDILLLVFHFSRAYCRELWMLSGTTKKRRYFPIHTIVEHLPDSIIPKVLAFHALTGCDTKSYMANHSKRSTWKVFKENYELLKDIGVQDLTD